jgi:UDP-N-acetylmuramate--alanine ligase
MQHHARHAHLVGIAGCGMRAMADVLLGHGWSISGSDPDAASLKLQNNHGVKLFSVHDAANLPDRLDWLIHSDAVPGDNPEIRRAVERGIAVSSYFQAVGQLSAGRRTLAVAGTHGKSTVTALAAHLLLHAGQDPTVFCGAAPLGAGSGGRAGQDHTVLVEACEYRANFLKLQPAQAAILGIEPDHFDCYPTFDKLEEAFRRFAEKVPADGLLLVRHDCSAARRVSSGLPCRVETYGFSPDADWSIREMAIGVPPRLWEIIRHGRLLCRTALRMPGRHNALNALAAAALAWHNGVAAEQIAAGLSGFRGLHRRLEIVGQWRGATLIEDYAHHPTAIAATLAAVREMLPGRRMWCVFQPHQALRTARLLDELAAGLQNTDILLVAEIFRAREGPPRPGEATAADLAARAAALGADVRPGHDPRQIAETLANHLAPGDVIVTLGAGPIDELRPWNHNGKAISGLL